MKWKTDDLPEGTKQRFYNLLDRFDEAVEHTIGHIHYITQNNNPKESRDDVEAGIASIKDLLETKQLICDQIFIEEPKKTEKRMK